MQNLRVYYLNTDDQHKQNVLKIDGFLVVYK